MPAPDLYAYLASLPNLATRNQNSLPASEFTLERIAALLAAAGDPQPAYASLHVAGTNGKGSVCALCAEALQAAGYRVGRFTSPHSQGALHGIVVNGQPASASQLQAAFEELYPYLDAAQGWTHFEIVVALMFIHFSRMGVNAAVVEVGLGGRDDATNVLLPNVSVITPIDYDHTAILGNNLAEIAAHKAGIIKPGVPVVSAPQPAEAAAVIAAAAAAQGALLAQVGHDWQVELLRADLNGQRLRVRRTGGDWHALGIGLLGEHQLYNAATAYAALQTLNEHGIPISDEAIAAGFAAARWPGRFEVLEGAPTTVLDGAHSPAAALALRAALDAYFPDVPIVLVLGVSADKDLPGLLQPLLPRVQRVIATQSQQQRAMPAAQLAQELGALGVRAAAEPLPAAALAAARAACPPGGLVLVAGSVFLVDEVRERMGVDS